MKSKYQTSNSFLRKSRIALALMGIIPFLLVIYIFVYNKIDLSKTGILFSSLALFFILAGFSLIRRSADQLVTLAIETGTIEARAKGKHVQINADLEMNDIAAHFNTAQKKLLETEKEIKEQGVQLMAYASDLSLSYRKAKEEEDLRKRLSRYVGNNLVEKLVNSNDMLLAENERKEVTILFADIRSFTSIAEKIAAEDVVSMLNEFFSAMVDIVFTNNGILDKFVGDNLMAVFGLIPSNKSAPHDAVKTAIEMQDAIENLMKVRAKEDKQVFEIGIGINTGSAIVGNVGSENRMDHTVIGDSVNIAARIQQAARGGEIIIGELTYRQTIGLFRIRKKGELQFKNKTGLVKCYGVSR
jgi:adenylate cyclase